MDKNKNKPPGTWISAAETATITGLTLRTVWGRAASGKMKAKIPVDVPLSEDGKQNYVFLLEDLSPNAQLEYHKLHLPEEQKCSIDLATPRSNYGDEYVNDFLNTAALVREAENIRRTYKNESTKYLMHLAEDNGISLSTLYRLCGKPAAKELSHCYLDPVYMQKSLPQTMCLWSADFVYALYLDHHQQFSQNAIFRELQKLEGLSCIDCPYYPGRQDLQDGEPICTKCEGTMVIPNNRRTLNRLLSQIPPQMLCYCRKGARQWRSEYGHHVVREKPMLVNEHWQGDHHVFDLFVRVKLKRYRNDRLYEQEIAVRPVLTAWMDTATSCMVGWCISIIPNADTIAEAFCRAVAFTVGDEFHGLPKTILVDCGKNYRSTSMSNDSMNEN